jgi:hypothetical protein
MNKEILWKTIKTLEKRKTLKHKSCTSKYSIHFQIPSTHLSGISNLYKPSEQFPVSTPGNAVIINVNRAL